MVDNLSEISQKSLRTEKQKINIAAQNIANASDPGYVNRKVIVSEETAGSTPQGVKVDSIIRSVDEFLLKHLQRATPGSAMYKILSESLIEIQDKLAKPGTSGIVEMLSNFFSSINDLSSSNDAAASLSVRDDIMGKANSLAGNITQIAKFLYQKRFDADAKIASSIDTINNTLDELRDLNAALLIQPKGSQGYASTEDGIQKNLLILSKYFDIRNYYDGEGILHVRILGRDDEIVGRIKYQLQYTKARDAYAFIGDDPLNSVNLVSFDGSKNPTIGRPIILVTGGKTGEVKHHFDSGGLAGWLELRDDIIPKLLDQIDVLAFQIAQKTNAIHNMGCGSIPATKLKSHYAVSGNTNFAGTGNVLISIVGNDGNPVNAGNYGRLPALKLDLGALGGTSGKFTTQDLIMEVNEHFGSAQRVEIDGIYDAKLVAAPPVAPGVNTDFDFELTTFSDDPKSTVVFRVDSVTVGSNTPMFINKDYSMQSGDKTRTRSALSFPLTPVELVSNQTIKIVGKVTTKGQEKPVTLVYKLGATLPTTRGKRISIDSVVVGEGVKILQQTPVQFANAELVDASGASIDTIASPTTKGHLNLKTANAELHLVVNSQTSDISGQVDDKTARNNLPFSEFFGLNNLFLTHIPDVNRHVDSTTEYKNAAIDLRVDDAIKDDPNLFSVSQPLPYTNLNGEDAKKFKDFFYTLGISNTQLISSYQKVIGAPLHFTKAGGIPETYAGGLREYSIQIIAMNNTNAITMTEKFKDAEGQRHSLEYQSQATTGVNLDEEVSNVLLYQQLYSVSAKVQSIARSLFDALLSSF
ncbi:flagellar hook-associated protein 1 FlgK [Alphaproteobacteria bacterium]